MGDQSPVGPCQGSRFSKESANIKDMVWLILSMNLFFREAAAAPQCDPRQGSDGLRMVERINERYDDFFRYRDHLEEREFERNKGRGDNKAALRAHAFRLEKARLEYLKNRRPKPDTSEMEAQAEIEFKARKARVEEARRCYVEQKRYVEQMLKRGRTIPPKKEFDIED